MELKYNEKQLLAIKMALKNKITIISGSAGTGKTSLIKAIVEKLSQHKCLVIAPTGKSSARLREATGFPTSTIHRALGFNGSIFMVKSLEGLYVIVDEASMVDSMLMYAIIKRKPEKLILVGDNAQLFPVGCGSPFHDIIKIKPEMVVELTESYRSYSAVHKAGNMIRNGKVPQKFMESGGEKYNFIIANNPNDVQEKILELVKDMDFSQDIIICPKNGKMDKDTGEYQNATVNGLNKAIVEIVNPGECLEGCKFKVGDRIICQKNFADMDVWNGTTGTVTGVDSKKYIWVNCDLLDEEVLFNSEMIAFSQLAYALTIHKAQGSQYRKVVIVCLSRDAAMLTRSLIYTAITRTMTECYVVGIQQAMYQAVSNVDDRKTVMKMIAMEKN